MSKWEPRAGVSRRGNPYAGVGPWHVSGPKKPRKAAGATRAGGGEVSDGAATFLVVLFAVVGGGLGLVVCVGAVVAVFEWNLVVGVFAVVIGVLGLVGQRRSVMAGRAARVAARSEATTEVMPPSRTTGVKETWR